MCIKTSCVRLVKKAGGEMQFSMCPLRSNWNTEIMCVKERCAWWVMPFIDINAIESVEELEECIDMGMCSIASIALFTPQDPMEGYLEEEEEEEEEEDEV